MLEGINGRKYVVPLDSDVLINFMPLQGDENYVQTPENTPNFTITAKHIVMTDDLIENSVSQYFQAYFNGSKIDTRIAWKSGSEELKTRD